jgi:hypothetical protein
MGAKSLDVVEEVELQTLPPGSLVLLRHDGLSTVECMDMRVVSIVFVCG